MANISKDTTAENANAHGGANVTNTNYISQINAGGTVYDIATHHSVTFVDGNGGEKTTWNGLTDIQVVIPSITDIVKTPVEFAGTVEKNGLTWVNGHSEPAEPGNLVFITEDCTFATIACEAGDMAIFNGTDWKVISGENQVKITGTTNSDIGESNRTVVAVGAAKDVLEVEGKALALTLDYTDLNNHVDPTGGDIESVTIEGLSVSSKTIKLKQDDAKSTEIGSDVTIKQATALASGVVELKNATNIINEITKPTFTPGTLPSFTENLEKRYNIEGGELQTDDGDDFVSSVSINAVTFTNSENETVNSISVLTGISKVDGKEFISGFTTATPETAELTIKGFAVPEDGIETTFVKGLKDSKLPVIDFTPGSFTLDTKDNKVAYGFGEESTNGEVVSRVSVSYNNNTEVLNGARVDENHVLHFNTANVTSNVSTTCFYKTLETAVYSWVAPNASVGEFETGGFTNVSDTYYKFEKAKETAYNQTETQWGLYTPELTINRGKYKIDHTTMKAVINAGEFVASADSGTLPTWTDMSYKTTNITGSVGTALSFADDVTVSKLNSNTIDLPGTYSLEEGEGEGSITVASAGATVSYTKATVNLEKYVTDVNIKE